MKQFEASLRADGLFAAMRWLNGRVPYRYSAVFRFDGDVLRNICLIDKENPNVFTCADQPITNSSVCTSAVQVRVSALKKLLIDRRVEDHPKRRNVQCYYGIPLYRAKGQMLGTVCHFDNSPTRVTEEVASALDDLGPLIADAAFSAENEL